MMYGWGTSYGGPGILGGLLMMAFWVVVVIGIILLVVWLTRQAAGGHPGGGHPEGYHAPGAGPQAESALDILKKRYARGEVDKAEFEEKKKDLTGQ